MPGKPKIHNKIKQALPGSGDFFVWQWPDQAIFHPVKERPGRKEILIGPVSPVAAWIDRVRGMMVVLYNY
jgi:hypothetical protein